MTIITSELNTSLEIKRPGPIPVLLVTGFKTLAVVGGRGAGGGDVILPLWDSLSSSIK